MLANSAPTSRGTSPRAAIGFRFISGVAALVEHRRCPRCPHPNRLAPAIEARIFDYAFERPTLSAQPVADELRLRGFDISPFLSRP